MSELYGATVFDEWAIIHVRDRKARVIHYIGPRRAEFVTGIAELKDALDGLLSNELGCGDFAFERHAVGPQADALLVLGPDTYLICNNTTLSIHQITQNPLWLQAQVPFAELAEKFRADPLVLARA
ncbi:MAG: hypothetical protein NZ739_11810 [Verrucomicrobiae bacterium]|nr:hypothetical protein [Verrucomicrobiae bacterium]